MGSLGSFSLSHTQRDANFAILDNDVGRFRVQVHRLVRPELSLTAFRSGRACFHWNLTLQGRSRLLGLQESRWY